jgi:hypothetical protein
MHVRCRDDGGIRSGNDRRIGPGLCRWIDVRVLRSWRIGICHRWRIRIVHRRRIWVAALSAWRRSRCTRGRRTGRTVAIVQHLTMDVP